MNSNSTEFSNHLKHIVFGWTDYVLFGGLLGISLCIGFFFGFCSKQDSSIEYLFGGKHMGYLPVALSVIASLLSGISLIGVPSEVYLHGAHYALTIVPTILVMVVTAYIFMPVFYQLQLSSIYEYLELRFSKGVRNFASVMYAVALLMYIPIVVYVPALAFSQVTGYNLHVITPVLSIVCITYTSMGGVKAVIWTDAIQFLFTIGGLVTLLILGILNVGGLTEVWKISKAGGRLDIFDFDPSPFARTSFWGMTFGLSFSWASSFTVGQKFIQRLLSIEKEKDIRKALLCTTIGSIILSIACLFTGLIMYAKYHDCDPLSTKVVTKSDQIVSYYVMDIAGDIPGLPGIFLAGIASSALSTMSAALNTLSGMIYEDFISGWIADGPNKDARAANMMKLLSVLIGLITIALIFIIEHLGTVFEIAISIRSSFEGPLLGIFILGIIFPIVGRKGALWGGYTAFIVMTWIIVGNKWHVMHRNIKYPNLPMSIEGCTDIGNQTIVSDIPGTTSVIPEDEPFILFQISMLYLNFYGTLITVVVGIIVSYLTGESKTVKVHPDYLAPFARRFLSEKRYEEVALQEMITKNKIKTKPDDTIEHRHSTYKT